MIVGGVGPSARQPAAPRTWKPSGNSSTSPPIARRPAASAEMRSLSLTRSSAAPVTCRSPPTVGHGGQRGQLVDQRRHLVGPERRGASAAARTRTRPRGSPCSTRSVDGPRGAGRGAGRRRGRCARGSGPGPAISRSDPGRAAAATAQNVADENRPARGLDGPPAAGCRPARPRSGRSGDFGAERPQRQLRMISCRGRLVYTSVVPSRLQARQQHRALHLGARHGGREVDAVQRAARNGDRRRDRRRR